MTRLSRLRDPGYAALAVVGLVTVTSHASLIWHHAVPDFDTDAIINQGSDAEICTRPWIVKGMGDTAHPLGNALLQRWSCAFRESDLLTPAQGWYLLLVGAVVALTAILVLCAHVFGRGPTTATFAVGYLCASPVMRTLSNRAEEDWIGASLFLLTTFCLLGFHRGRSRRTAWLVAVGVCSVVLGLWHSQYLLVLAMGLVPWGLLGLLRPGLTGTTRRGVLLLGATMAVPTGLVLGALFGSGYAVRTPYHTMYFSIFNPAYWEGIVAWCRNFAGYASRWLTGWLGNDGMQEKLFAAPSGVFFVLLGALALSIFAIAAALTRNSVLMAVAFGTVALPFLYEPHNAERWDPAAAILALVLAYGVHARRETREAVAGPAREPEEAGEQDPQMSRKVSMFAPSRFRRSASPS